MTGMRKKGSMSDSYTREEIEKRVADALVSFGVDREAIARETTLEELDVDSLDVVELAEMLRDLGIDIEGRDFEGARTYGDAIDVVIARAKVS